MIENPTKSIRKIAKEVNVSKTTIRIHLKTLGLSSYVRRHRQLLSNAAKVKRVERSKKLLGKLKKSTPSQVRIFSDEKNWTVDQARNARNDRYIAHSPKEVPVINRTKYPASAMMLGVVGSDGKRMPPFWFPKGLRVGTKEYLEVMEGTVKPWLDANYPDNNYPSKTILID